MRTSAFLVLALIASTASAEPVRAPVPTSGTCEAAGTRVAQLVTAGDHAAVRLVAQRCDRDRWSVSARSCFAAATTELGAASCLDQLSKDQARAFAGDVDRLDVKPTARRLGQWLSRKPQAAFAPVPAKRALFTLAVESDAPVVKTKALHAEGMTAYRAGHYDLAVKKFQAANDADPSPELVYHLAQAYRLKGEYRMALELYERYLELAPDGAAAPDSRHQIEVLLDQLP